MQLLDYTLGEILEKWAFETPDKEFMVYPDRNLRFSYKQFNDRVNALAKGLLYIGIGKGDKVAIWAKNIPDWVTLMFASAKIGAVFVPVNYNSGETELEFLLEHADIKALCLDGGSRADEQVQMIYRLIPELKQHPREKLVSEKFPELKNVIFIGPNKYKGMFNTAELLLVAGHMDDLELENASGLVDVHDVTTIQYTSGTTGEPKGAMLSHYGILNNGYSVGQCMRFTPNEKLLVCVPLFHTFGNVLAVCAIVSHGATMVVNEEFDPLLVLASVQKEKCTALYGVPTMFIEELNHPMFDLFDLRSLRTGIMAGAPCPVDIMKQVMEKMHMKDVIIVYGLAEASPAMTATRSHNPAEIRSSTVGFELPNVEVKIVDSKTGNACKPGEQGEICCRGYNVMKGYYKDEEATRKTIDEEGWLHSGDLAVKTSEGFYKITGRLDELINRGGESFYPGETEQFLSGMEQVEKVAVTGIPDKKYGQEVVAFVVTKKGLHITAEEIREYCRGKIARFKIPRHIFFMDELPVTPNGKVQKFKLATLASQLIESKE